jgi:hypothetical protein
MIRDVDEVLRKLLTQELKNSAVNIAFGQPKREWSSRLGNRPTLNLFLCDLRENNTLRQPGWEIERNGDGTATKRRTAVRMDLHYMITAWATDPEDEHHLLTRALMALFRHPDLPEDLLPASLQDQPMPIPVSVAQHDRLRNLADIWSALDNEWRPAISCVITLAINPYDRKGLDLVRTRDLRFGQATGLPEHRRTDKAAGEDHLWMVGGAVRGDRPRKFLFSVGLEFRGQLQQGILSRGLREAFENRGFLLSDDAIVTQEGTTQWRIDDGTQTYSVIRENEELNIYRVENVQITLVERGLDVPVREDDQFIIGNLEEGDYTLEVSVEGHEPSRHKIAVPSEDYDIKT